MSNKSLAKAPESTCVLVTGGAGFIGSHTCVELIERGYSVVVVDDLSNSSAKAIDRVRAITGTEGTDRLTFYEASILDEAALELVFARHDIDAIIHFAGLKAVGESVVELLRPIREEATRLLADKAYLQKVCADGAQKASYVAEKTLRKVYKKVGFVAR